MKEYKKIIALVLPIVGRKQALALAALGIVTGLCGFVFIQAVTKVIGIIIAGGFNTISREYVVVFITIILLYIWSRRSLALMTINVSARLGWTLRKQMVLLVLHSDYQRVSNRIPQIQMSINNDVNQLTNAAFTIINFLTALIMSLTCCVYLATISWLLFVLTFVVIVVGVGVYYYNARANIRSLQKSRQLENTFQANLNAVLHGFKEIYMEPGKGEYIYNHKISTLARESHGHNLTAMSGLINNQVTGQILFYILISSILLVFSVLLNIKANDIVSYVFTLLYLLGSVESIMGQLPTLLRAGVASGQVFNLQKELEAANRNVPQSEGAVFGETFETLSVRDLEFAYHEAEPYFKVGPISLEVKKGEIVFLYGENGSGKTTLIQSIIGLYRPVAGAISVNGIAVEATAHTQYKRLFSVVFSNFYLFTEILDQGVFDAEKWNYYLELFELQHKVSITGKQFSNTDLSTGQRKRLALITALLEKKPILVIDEWAADQDPYFRRKFYTRILPLLAKEGFAIIAITHDDKYYHCADRLYKMDKGWLVEENVFLHKREAGTRETFYAAD
jgi:cyclic peptide transporter